jgi:hypothetical protein
MELRKGLLELVNQKHGDVMDLYDRHYDHGYSTIVENIPVLDAALAASIDPILEETFNKINEDIIELIPDELAQEIARRNLRKHLGLIASPACLLEPSCTGCL